MTNPEVARLGDEGAQSLRDGQSQRAHDCYVALERLEPANPQWARGTAIALHQLGQPEHACTALHRAATIFAKQGDVLKAATTCKQILAVAPQHPETLRLIRELRSAWGQQPQQPPQPPPVPSVQPRATSWAKKNEAGLETLPLREVVPGASSVQGHSGIYQIPLEEPEELTLTFTEEVSRTMEAPEVVVDLHGNVNKPPPKDLSSTEDMLVLAVEQEVRAAEKANKALTNTPLFSELNEKSFSDLLMFAELVELKKDEELFKQGATGDALYVVAEGTVGVVDEGPPRRGITKLKEGDFFGEIALVTDQPRSATIVAMEEAQLIAINRDVMRKLIESDQQVLTILLRFLRDRMVDRLLATNPLFKVLSARDREALKPRFRFLEVDEGALLLAEGRQPTGLILLMSGQAEIVRQGDGGEVQLGVLNPGELCGEMSLLTEGSAIAGVRVKKKCFAIELPAKDFNKIIHAKPEAMAFVKKVAEQRALQAKAILSGKARYAEGKLHVL